MHSYVTEDYVAVNNKSADRKTAKTTNDSKILPSHKRAKSLGNSCKRQTILMWVEVAANLWGKNILYEKS